MIDSESGAGNIPKKNDETQMSKADIKASLRELIREKSAQMRAQEDTFIESRARKVMWEHDRKLTPEALEGMLLSEEFGRSVVESIKKTYAGGDKEGRSQLKEREYGFIVYGDSWTGAEDLHVSPVFEGDEHSINLFQQGQDYLALNPHLGEKRTIAFHTHPNLYLYNHLSSLVGIKNSSWEHDYFSVDDLSGFRIIAERENPSLVYALGTKNRIGKDGKLLLVSFNNFDKFEKFDPEAVVSKSREYKKMEKGSPLRVYKDVGLNSIVLPVHMGRTAPLDVAQVWKASRILTTRVA